MGVSKAPAHIGHVAVVGAGRPDEIWVLARALPIPGPQDGGAEPIAVGQRVQFVANCVDRLVKRIFVARLVRVLGASILAGQRLAVQETLTRAVLNRDGKAQLAKNGAQKDERASQLHYGEGSQRSQPYERGIQEHECRTQQEVSELPIEGGQLGFMSL